MLRDSLDALRATIKAAFPTVTRIYVNDEPDNFVRPSFFIDLITQQGEPLTANSYELRALWRVVYHAPENADHNDDKLAAYTAIDTMSAALTQGIYIAKDSAKTSQQFYISSCDVGQNDAGVFAAVTLEAQLKRSGATYPTMKDIHNSINKL